MGEVGPAMVPTVELETAGISAVSAKEGRNGGTSVAKGGGETPAP